MTLRIETWSRAFLSEVPFGAGDRGVHFPAMRRGFTLIEILVSVSIIAVLGLMAVPGTVRALARGGVNKGADEILRITGQAQILARRGVPSGPVESLPHYGVALLPLADGRVRLTIVYGDDAADTWLVDGIPGYEKTLPASLAVLVGQAEATPAPLAAPLVWFYQYGSGRPIVSPADQRPVSIGTRSTPPRSADLVFTGEDTYYTQTLPAVPFSPVCSDLQVRHARGGSYVVAFTQYPIGLANAEAL